MIHHKAKKLQAATRGNLRVVIIMAKGSFFLSLGIVLLGF